MTIFSLSIEHFPVNVTRSGPIAIGLQTDRFLHYFYRSFEKLKTIDEVIAALEQVVQNAKQEQARYGYFAILYLQMTKAVKAAIANNEFEDGPRMEKLDVAFASRYLDALASWKAGQPCTAAWKTALDETRKNSISVLQHVLCGINAHINLDLAIAAAEIAPAEAIASLKNDFVKINNVILRLTNQFQDKLDGISWPMRFLDDIGGSVDEDIANFSIGVAREVSWFSATELAKLSDSEKTAYIHNMDFVTEKLARGIIHPGFLANLVFWPVRWFEPGDVVEIMGELEG